MYLNEQVIIIVEMLQMKGLRKFEFMPKPAVPEG